MEKIKSYLCGKIFGHFLKFESEDYGYCKFCKHVVDYSYFYFCVDNSWRGVFHYLKHKIKDKLNLNKDSTLPF